jgi:hypothetical protein
VTPFLQFRHWVRRGPAAERAVTAVIGAIVLGFVIWAAVPSGSIAGGDAVGPQAVGITGASGETAAGADENPGAATGGASPTSAPAAAVASVAKTASSTVGGAAPAATQAANPCADLRSTDQGVTATTINIDVVLFQLAGAASNKFIGVPEPAEQQADFEAVINSINKAGGIQCRKLAAKYYTGNFLDASQQHATCLQIVQDKPFAVLDNVALDSTQQGRDCVAENKIPLFDTGAILGSETRGRLFPYLFTIAGQFDVAIRNSIFGAQKLGWYKGMNKIGILADDCFPEVNAQIVQNLGEIGITDKQIVTHVFGGCPTIPPPQEVEQAVLSFQTSGVTHVLDLSQVPKSGYFSKAAAAQRYRPKYNVTGGAPSVFDGSSGSSAGPDPANFDGAISITELSYGEQNTPGLAHSPATAACNKIMAGAGLQPVEKQGAFFGGEVCNVTWMFQMAADRAAPLTRLNLVVGLAKAGPWLQSFPGGSGVFDRPGLVSAGQHWRADIYDGSCPCFRIPDPTWLPSL